MEKLFENELLEVVKFLDNTDDKRNIKNFKHYEIILDFIGYLEYNKNPNAYSFPKDKLFNGVWRKQFRAFITNSFKFYFTQNKKTSTIFISVNALIL